MTKRRILTVFLAMLLVFTMISPVWGRCQWDGYKWPEDQHEDITFDLVEWSFDQAGLTWMKDRIRTAAQKWSWVSTFNFREVGVGPNHLKLVDFAVEFPWAVNAPGIALINLYCLNWVGEVDTYFNSLYSWNDNCIMNEGTDADALTVALHEFGHWMVFRHECWFDTVMCPDWTCKQNLFDSDRDAMMSVYGW